MDKQVVVLGAGVGGLSAADAVRSLIPQSDRVVVVDRAPQHVLGLSLPWVMRGWRKSENVVVTPSVLAQRGIDLIEDDVVSIDVADRRISLKDGELRYDALVLALGAVLNSDRIPGLREALKTPRAGEYYTLAGAESLHGKLQSLEEGRVAVVVASTPFKCPAAPYEGALLISDLFTERGVRNAVQIDVYTPEVLPMPVAGPAVGKELVKLLEANNIGFHPQHSLELVDGAVGELRFVDGQHAIFDLLVAVPPHQAPPAVAAAGFSPQGWVPVDPRTLRTSTTGVWALGDVSSLALENGKPLPKAAVFAEGEAEAVAAGVARFLGYEAPEPWFQGKGHCWIDVGAGQAAKGAGDFMASPGPQVELFGPSLEFHAEREAEERRWAARWSAGEHDPELVS